MNNCVKSNNQHWETVHGFVLQRLLDLLPSGSGIDSGTKLLEDKSSTDKLVFQADFHHMDEHGYYDGWTEHQVIVKPSLQFGITIRITGRDRNQIKDYLLDLFHECLQEEVDSNKFYEEYEKRK